MRLITLIVTTALTTSAMASSLKTSKETLLNNEQVEVVRITYPVGAESGFHTHQHPHRVVYLLQGGTLKMVPQNAPDNARVVEAKTGDTMFIPGNSHNVINVGQTEVILLETELKSGAKQP